MDNLPSLPLAFLDSLPPEWRRDSGVELLQVIQERLQQDPRTVVVLDDDPTGTQTVHGIHVLTGWSQPALRAELAMGPPAFYILTNSRSLPLDESQRLHEQIGANLKAAAQQAGRQIDVISRSDSTLRGHFPGETDALANTLGLESAPYLIVPFFLEGGRYTLDDVHYVREGDRLIPAAQTSYARDAVFGYQNSNLREWVAEKTGGAIPAGKVASISLDNMRGGDVKAVTQTLADLAPGSACVVNAISYRDLEVFVLGLLEAEARGKIFLPRTAASFVRVRLGMRPRPLLEASDLVTGNAHGGLFVVGSYVPKTSDQVRALLAQTPVTAVEVRVGHLLDDQTQAGEVRSAAESAERAIAAGGDVVVYTSRELVKVADARQNLAIGRRVSESLVAIVQAIGVQPRYLVAKGGITSSDMATKGLGVRRALVLGQVLPGVPVWKLGEESRYPGMPLIVFPGNVGERGALVQIQQRLSPTPHES